MEAAIDMVIESLGLRLPLRRYTEDDAGKIELPASQLEKDAGSRLIAKLRERKENGNQGGERTPVLLLHGASAGRQTFEIPRALNFVNFLLLYTNALAARLAGQPERHGSDADGRPLRRRLHFR